MDVHGSFADEAVQRCPFPLIEKLHQEAPVYIDPITGFYVVSRYDDVAYISAHPELFSNTTTVILGGDDTAPSHAEVTRLYAEHGYQRLHTLVTNDPPSHTRYRAIVDKVFTASFVKGLHPYITALCNELVDEFIADGKTDLRQNYCLKIPMFVISDQLGVPREKWLTFKEWSDSAIALINPALETEERIRLVKIHIEMQQYLAKRMTEYRAAPVDNFLSHLATAELDGDTLSTAEFVSIAEQFLVAGNETTTGGIAHAIAMLIRDPALTATLRAEPAKIDNFVEEVLRMHAPSPHLYRQVLKETEISGVLLPKDSVIMLSYLAGNYDPAKYKCPEQVDLARPGIRNHLAFGRGIHYCIGNLLARSEMRVAVATILDRLADFQFDPAYPEPQFAAVYHIHQLDSLRIVFTPKG
jgi:cytochrome P450